VAAGGLQVVCSHLLTLVHRSRIFLFSSTLKLEAIRSSETSVYTISSRRHIPEDGILLYFVFVLGSGLATG
jgi:hypothetical protein